MQIIQTILVWVGPGGLLGAALVSSIAWPTNEPCYTEKTHECFDNVAGVDLCRSDSPICENVWGFGFSGMSESLVPPIVIGMVVGGIANVIVMSALRRGIWGHKG